MCYLLFSKTEKKSRTTSESIHIVVLCPVVHMRLHGAVFYHIKEDTSRTPPLGYMSSPGNGSMSMRDAVYLLELEAARAEVRQSPGVCRHGDPSRLHKVYWYFCQVSTPCVCDTCSERLTAGAYYPTHYRQCVKCPSVICQTCYYQLER